jgi:hypothetical protein
MRLAASAFFAGDPETGAWSGVDPTVLHCACSDGADLARAVRSVSELSWQRLDDAIAHLGPEPECGTHKLWLGRVIRSGSSGFPIGLAAAVIVLIAGVVALAASPKFRHRSVAAAEPARQVTPAKSVAKPAPKKRPASPPAASRVPAKSTPASRTK